MTAQTSEHGAYIRGLAAGTLSLAYGPVDTGATRDALLNNLVHLHDSNGQTICNLVLGATEYFEQDTAATGEFPRAIKGVAPLPFPLRINPATGDSCPLIVCITASGGAVGTVTFRAELSFAGERTRVAPAIPSAAEVHVADVSTTSTTGAPLIFAPIYLTGEKIAAGVAAGHAVVSYPSLDADGNPATARFFLARFTLYAKTTSGKPRLHAVTARTYTGEV